MLEFFLFLLNLNYFFYIAGFCLFVNTSGAQTNLVQNPSFETYTTCPAAGNSFMYYAPPWDSYIDSPDYFHMCAGASAYGVPLNSGDYQVPATGDAYAGFGAFVKSGLSREIIGAPLSASLTIGTRYYVSVKFSLAALDANTKQFIPCNNAGLRFSTIPFTNLTPPPINNFAHIYSSAIISDTLNWTVVQGSFVADSNYAFIMIGNFFDDANTSHINRPGAFASYFFVDDVCVSTSSLTCNVVTTGVESSGHDRNFSIGPNPANTFLFVSNAAAGEVNEISVLNTLGAELYKNTFINELQIGLSDIPEGVYFAYIRSAYYTSVKKIIIKR
ncbi:MAG: T9SS type A sorting domain-containing protein [Bacteroidia bacterium]